MKILVTGGLGYIGSHTVVELYRHGHTAIIVDDLSNSEATVLPAVERLTGAKIPFYETNILDEVNSTRIFEHESPIDGIIHFAAKKSVNESMEQPLMYFENNIKGLINLMRLIEDFQVPYLVFSSSCTVYGQPNVVPVSESTPTTKSLTPYGNSKLIAEMMLDEYTRLHDGLGTVLLRYFNPVGAHESGEIGELPRGVPQNLMPFITQSAAGLRPALKVFGHDYDTRDGTAIRDYIHVVDLADAHVKAIEWLQEHPNEVEYFNVGTGVGQTVLEVIDSFERSTGQKLAYEKVERRLGDIEQIWADTTKVEQVLGWKAQRSIDDMTSSAWNWEMKLRGLK
jgi:UDP-glucose 4-epimerase